jgi:hypothetical protein
LVAARPERAKQIERNYEMIRKLKAIAPALVATLAMGSVAAPASSADDLTSETTPLTLTGRQTGGGDVLTMTAPTIRCKEINYAASSAVTPTTAVSVTPSYPEKTAGGEQNCSGFGFPATVETHGCTYRYTVNAATTGGLEIICPVGQEITFTLKSAGVTKCTIHVPAQSFPASITYSNTGAGTTREINVAANIAGALAYKHTAGTGIGACTTGSGSGSYSGAGIVTGENGGTHVGIFLS